MFKKGLFLIVFVAFAVFSGLFLGVVPLVAFASTSNGTVDLSSTYAWGDNLGWINFGCTNCNVHITDTGMTGYAWSRQFGWINLSPSHGGVTISSTGKLGGYAWSSNLGWINFGEGSATIDSSGAIRGTVGNPSSKAGQITFGGDGNCSYCSVKTDYKPASVRTTTSSGGGGGGGAVIQNLSGDFSVIINNGDKITKTRAVALTFKGADSNILSMAVSNFADLHDASQQKYVSTLNWDLCSLAGVSDSKCDEGIKTVYAKFYSSGGVSSVTFSQTINFSKTEDGGVTAGEAKLDIKSVEYRNWYEKTVKRADATYDGVVDVLDFNVLMVNWGSKKIGISADINGDGKVDIFDLNMIMVHWGKKYK